MYRVTLSKQALKDLEKIKQAGYAEKVFKLVTLLTVNPYQNSPPYEKLGGDLQGYYSRRINIQHRLVYEIFEDVRMVRILRMWTHYE